MSFTDVQVQLFIARETFIEQTGSLSSQIPLARGIDWSGFIAGPDVMPIVHHSQKEKEKKWLYRRVMFIGTWRDGDLEPWSIMVWMARVKVPPTTTSFGEKKHDCWNMRKTTAISTSREMRPTIRVADMLMVASPIRWFSRLWWAYLDLSSSDVRPPTCWLIVQCTWCVIDQCHRAYWGRQFPWENY